MLTALTVLLVVFALVSAGLSVLAACSGHPSLYGTILYEDSRTWRAVAVVAAAVTSVLLLLSALVTWLATLF